MKSKFREEVPWSLSVPRMLHSFTEKLAQSMPAALHTVVTPPPRLSPRKGGRLVSRVRPQPVRARVTNSSHLCENQAQPRHKISICIFLLLAMLCPLWLGGGVCSQSTPPPRRGLDLDIVLLLAHRSIPVVPSSFSLAYFPLSSPNLLSTFIHRFLCGFYALPYPIHKLSFENSSPKSRNVDRFTHCYILSA